MAKIGLFYGSKRGSTKDAAERIKAEFDAIAPGVVEVFNIKNVEPDALNGYEKLILGSSTWEKGKPQVHWKRFLPNLEAQDLSGKQVAVFGLGNQSEFCTTFQGGMAILARTARERGAQLIGSWPINGYCFEESPGVENGMFLGLALDYTNQEELTKERIQEWVQQIASEFGLV